jgi:Methyltransferase domain
MSLMQDLPRLFTSPTWQMAPGERAALAGIVSALQPGLAIEIGTADGDSLDVIAAHSREVHAFDLERRAGVTDERFPNVTFHICDSHALLPRLLDELAGAGKNVDFALVDGDHSARGVRADVEDLLNARSVGRTVIAIHDTLNERVRGGLEAVDFAAFERVAHVDLDFVPGQVLRKREGDEPWCGLGIVLVGWDVGSDAAWRETHSAADVTAAFLGRSAPGGGHYHVVADLERQLDHLGDVIERMRRSWSWRATGPFRRLARAARARRRAGPPAG